MFWKNPCGIILATGLMLTGCRGGLVNHAVIVNSDAFAPHPQILALTQKPIGDNGKPLVDPDSNDGNDTAAPAAENASVTTPQNISIEKLTPSAGLHGLVVCEPTAAIADAATADFGAGCGRWLHLTVGGQPELGQTPLWSSLQRAQSELGRTDLRLPFVQAKRLANILGITHVAVGQIQGNAAHCTLTYQLWAIPSGKAVGLPIQALGTATQVTNQLPHLARVLAAQLGIAQPRIAASVNAGPNDLSLLGTLPWLPGGAPTPTQIVQLRSMAARMPLAGVLLFNTATPGVSDLQTTHETQTLLSQAPDNPLVWSLVGRDAPAQIAPHQAQLAQNLQNFPHSYLFATAQTWLQRSLGHSGLEMHWAEQTVRDAPGNADAWLTLGSTVSQSAETVRKSRLASEMTDSEWLFLNTTYKQWLEAVSRSAQLDPQFGLAWQRVSEAATFAGNMTMADHAFWRSVQLQPDTPDAYRWGLEMYQPKWTDAPDAPAKLHKTAELLATTHFSTFTKSLEAVSDLKAQDTEGHPYRALLRSLCTSLLPQTQQKIARNPGDAQAHYDQAYLLESAGRKSEALTEYKNVLVLRPKDYDTWWRVAKLYDGQHQTTEAITAYQTLLRIDATDAAVHYALGWDLKAAGRFPEAEAEMKHAIHLSPDYAEAHFGLGYVYLEEKRPKEAILELQAATRLRPSLVEVNQQLCPLLDEQGEYDASIAAGEQALRYAPTDNNTMDTIADDYLHKRDWATSIRASQAALRINPQDAIAHINLGDAYNGTGDRAAARAEWQQTVTLDNGDTAKDARANLAKYP